MSAADRGRDNYRWQGGRASEADFATGEDEGSSQSAGGNPSEILYAEIGDDNGVSSQFASYRAVQVGGPRGSNPRSGEGKIYADLNSDEADTATNQRTQIRWVKRPLNGDTRTILSEWYTLRDLEVSDVEDRVHLPPVVDENGNRVVVREGDVLALEARNPSSSFTIDISGSELEFPAQFGY
jgi:hypothetical protein